MNVDLEKLKRVENLEVGDRVKAWADDLEVVSARPQTDGTVAVDYEGIGTVEYGAGSVVETA